MVKPEEIYPFDKDKKLSDWKSIVIKNTDIVLYYDTFSNEEFAKETREGFNFYCVENCKWNENNEVEKCECLFRGTAFFDGVRHFYVGDKKTNNYGYLYYLEINEFILALKELEGLEKIYCNKDF